MSVPKLYRKRLIPEELIPLDNDRILTCTESIVVTSWETIRPRKDFHHGCSVFYLNEGWKVSRFFREDGTLKYTYCDIVAFDRDEKENILTVTDLLADVIIEPDGLVRVVDLDELSEAFKSGLISSDQLTSCLEILNALLTRIYAGDLGALTAPLNDVTFH